MASKIYLMNGQKLQFDYITFCDLFKRYKVAEKKTISECEEQLADTLHVTSSAVHMWRNRKNSPGDIEMVRSIADFLQIKEWPLLLLPYKEEHKMTSLTELQIDATKRIYDTIIDLLYDFESTDGYEDTWSDAECDGFDDPTAFVDDHFAKMYADIEKAYMKEHIYLRGAAIYNDLLSYIQEGIFSLRDTAISCIENNVRHNNPTWSTELYQQRLKELHNITEKYI